MRAVLQVQLFGSFALLVDEQPVLALRTPRLQSLFASLLLNRRAPLSRSRLAYMLWPESSDAQAHTNLRNLLFWLRRSLPACSRFLRLERDGITWSEDVEIDLDVERFETLLQRAEADGRQGEVEQSCELIEQAAALYKADLLYDCYEDWIVPERERLRQLHENSLWQLVQILEARQEYGRAIRYAQTLLRYDPVSESCYRLLMHLYASSGQAPLAAQVYRQCVQVLKAEMDIFPGLATQQLYESITNKLAASPAEASLGAHKHNGSGQYARGGIAHHIGVELPLVGREAEWGAVLRSWWRAAQGDSHLLLVQGEPGLGRTRLLQELQTWAAPQGVPSYWISCHQFAQELAFAPLAAWFDDGTFSQVDSKPDRDASNDMDSGLRCLHIFESIADKILVKDAVSLIIIDDLDWCDPVTLQWLEFILHHRNESRFLLAVAACPPGLVDNTALAIMFAALAFESRLAVVDLKPLNKEQSASLACGVMGCAIEESRLQEWYKLSEGWPLLIIDQAQQAQGHRVDPAQPTPVQACLQLRLGNLSAQARELAGLANILGRQFSYDYLQQASQLDPVKLAAGLDELLRRRILRELDGDQLIFTHGCLQTELARQMSTARRRALVHQLQTVAYTPM